MLTYSRYFGGIRNRILGAVAVLILLGFFVQSVVGTTYYSMVMQAYGTVGSPPVILEEGNCSGTSTIYANKTSAKVNVEAPLFDYVDNNDPDVDSIADKGMHSNFSAQQYGPDSIHDTLEEENTEAIENYVDSISNVDNSTDVGSHSNFENQKYYDSIYDTLTEQNTGVGEIAKVGTDTSGTGTTSPLEFSHTLVAGSNRLVVVSIGIENNGDIDVSAVTYGGQSLTKAVDGATGTTGYIYVCEIWYILEANLPSNGAQTVSITLTGTPSSMEINAICSEYTGVTQGAPEATDNTDEPSPADDTIENTISPSTGAWVISAVGCGNVGSFTHGQGQVEILDFADASSTFAVAELRGASGETSLDSTYATGANRMDRVASSWTGVAAADNYELDLEIQFTTVIDFLPTETLCINTGTFSGTEDINVDFWNGTGWENLATDLTAYSCNYYTVSLTSTTFTIRFRDGTTDGDTTQDQWQIDASLLRVEGAGSKEDAVDQQSNVEDPPDVGTHSNFTAQQYGPDSINDTLTEVEVSVSDNNNVDSEIVTYGSTTGISGAQAVDGVTENMTEGTIAGGTPVLENYEVNEANDVTSISVNRPSGTTEGELLIIVCTTDDTGSTLNNPSGFTDLLPESQAGGQTTASWYKEATASEPTSYSVSWFGSEDAVIGCFRISGWDSSDFPHTSNTNTGSGDTIFPAVTTTKDNCLLLRFFGMDDDDDTEPIGGCPADHTELYARATTSLSGECTGAACHRDWASAGDTGTATWAHNSGEGWYSATIAIASPVVGYQLDVEHVVNSIAQYENYNLTTRAYRSAENFYLQLYNFSSSQWVNMSTISASSLTWYNTTFAKADFVNSTNQARIRYWQGAGAAQETLYVDYSGVYGWNATYYKLDLEGHWTDLLYSLPNEELCIYAGAMGTEDIKVDVWNGSSWVNVISDLNASAWNNVTITSYLTSGNFTIRFKCGNEAGDTNPDTWDIDVALIRVWHDGGESYELDLEVRWTTAYYTRTNEELCIRTGTFSGSENIQVKVWNSTGSSWDWIMNLTASQWNNMSITSYLKSSTFTVQFLGGTETGDTTQDSWNIDATLLRVWNSESTDYVDNDTSNVDSSADKGTHGNFSAQQYGPDSINDTITESWEGGGTVWLWQEDTSGYTPTSSYETYEFWNSWTTNSTTSGTVTKIGIYVFADPGNSPQVKLGIYDDSGDSPNNLLGETNATTITGAGWLDLEINGGGVSISASTTYHVAHITDIAPTTQWRYYKTATPVSDYRNGISFPSLFDPAGTTTKSGSYRYGAYRVGYDEPSGYRLDLEVQWTTNYTTYEELCIKTGTFNGSEDVMVYAWNVSAPDWHFLYNLTANSWNNISVTDWFFNENFTVRFLGGTETNDTNQDSWNIDVSLLHVSTSNGTYDYVLQVVNQIADNWTINLQVYDSSNIARLSKTTISFHDGTTSDQIIVNDGAITQPKGPSYNLAGNETIYISMSNLQATTTGTSYLYVHLKIKVPSTSSYMLYIITFEIT